MVQPSVQCVVVMGVSGSGKTTVAQDLARVTGWTFAEGDDFHPASNRAKMAGGTPLTDEDRWPWLRAIGVWMDEQAAAGVSTVITCSALRRPYRDLLRERRPQVRFCHVHVSEDELRRRLEQRQGHYMPASLLGSQLATLEPLGPDEPGVTVEATGGPEHVLVQVVRALGLHPVDGG